MPVKLRRKHASKHRKARALPLGSHKERYESLVTAPRIRSAPQSSDKARICDIARVDFALTGK